MAILIVDENDQVIGKKDRDKINFDTDIYRVSALWITNSKGQILLAKRSASKNMWGPAVAGTVEENESYFSNILKEAEEELGLKYIKPEIGPKQLVRSRYTHFTQWYFLQLDQPLSYFRPSEEEVSQIKWFTKEEIAQLLEKDSDQVLTSIKIMIKRTLLRNL